MPQDASATSPPDAVAIVESLAGIVWEAAPDPLTFTYVSPQAGQIARLAPARWLEADFLRLHSHADDLERCLAGCAEAAAAESTRAFEHRLLAEDGAVVALRTIVTGLRTGAGELRLRGFSTDAAVGTAATAPAADVVGQAAGESAHDFSNLLTVISGYAETLLGALAPDDPNREDVVEILRAADRATALARQMVVARPPASASPGDPTASGREGAVVLLAEDDDRVRDLATKVLQRHGYVVLAAASGEEALALYHDRVGAIDVLVTDVMMGAISGPELADRVLSQQPGVAVVYMSGYGADVLGDSPRHPAFRFLAKPFAPSDLASSVQEALARTALPPPF